MKKLKYQYVREGLTKGAVVRSPAMFEQPVWKPGVREWLIESDPEPDCGFRKGAAFDNYEVEMMLALGSFSNCTILRNNDKQYYVMPKLDDKKNRQELVLKTEMI